jgi:glutamate racemase
MQASQPIGIFDSGVGGLAVARVVKDLLPYESIYYVGDTARLPYGEQTMANIQSYTKAIGKWLLEQHCKVILIACNTATAAAADQLQEQVGPQIPVLNVIDPVIDCVKQKYAGKKIGLIATNYTIQSQVYTQKLQAAQTGIRLKALSAPLLVPMVETNHYQADVVAQYLSNPQLANIQALILGCTHYWFLKEPIAQYYQHQVALIDGAHLLAKYLQELLETLELASPIYNRPQDFFVATKLTDHFQLMTKRLFGATVDLINLSELND